MKLHYIVLSLLCSFSAIELMSVDRARAENSITYDTVTYCSWRTPIIEAFTKLFPEYSLANDEIASDYSNSEILFERPIETDRYIKIGIVYDSKPNAFALPAVKKVAEHNESPATILLTAGLLNVV